MVKRVRRTELVERRSLQLRENLLPFFFFRFFSFSLLLLFLSILDWGTSKDVDVEDKVVGFLQSDPVITKIVKGFMVILQLQQ